MACNETNFEVLGIPVETFYSTKISNGIGARKRIQMVLAYGLQKMGQEVCLCEFGKLL
jgi:hypothetical protein